MSEKISSEKKLLEFLLVEEIDQKVLSDSLKKLEALLGLDGSFLNLNSTQSTFELKIGEISPETKSYLAARKIVSIKASQDSKLTLIPLGIKKFNAILGLKFRNGSEALITNLLPVIKKVFKKLCIDFLIDNASFSIDNSLFGKLIRSTNDLLVIHHMDGTIKYVNQAVLKHSGYGISDVIGKKISLFLPPDELQKMQVRFNNRKSGKRKTFLFESKFLNSKGECIPVEVSTFPLEKNEDFQHIVVIARDISEKKHLISELGSQKKHLETTLEGIGDAVITTDINFKITFVNKKAEQLIGAKNQSLLGKSLFNFFGPSTRNPAFFKQSIDQVRKKKTAVNMELPLKLGTGKKKYHVLINSISPILDSKNKTMNGIVIVFHDVSDQVYLQQQLKVKEEQMTNLVNNLHGVVYRCKVDENWTMLYLSDGIKKLTGYSPKELLFNKKVKFSEIIYSEDRGKNRDEILKSLQQNKNFQTTYRIVTKQGEIKWVWEQGRKITDADGNQLIEGYIMDITEKQLAQQKVAHLNRILYVIRNINQLIVREKEEAKFLSQSCQLIADSGDFNFAWIAKLDENFNIDLIFSDENKPLPFIKDQLRKWLLNQSKNNKKFSIVELKSAINGSKKLVVTTLTYGKAIYGGLVVGLAEDVVLSDEEEKLFIEMSDDLGYAIHMRQLEKQSDLVKNSIEVINKKLKGKTSIAILSSLVKNLAKVLQTEYVFIRKFDPHSKDKMNTLLFFNEGQFQKNLIYEIKDTPSQLILEKGTLAIKKGVRKIFNKDKLLHQFGAEGYLGTSVYSSSGQKIGVFATFSKRPISNENFVKSIIEFFAHRIGLEIERMDAEVKLRISEEKFKNIFKHSPFGIYQTSLDGKVLEANPALLKMLGYKNLNELQERNIEKEGYLHSDGRKRFLEKALHAKGFIVHEDIWLKKDKTPIYIREKARVVKDEQGNVLYIEGTVEDISERKAREEEILYQSQILAAAQDPIIATDLDNRITYWNKSAEKFYGFKENEVKGRLIEDVIKMAIPFEERLKIREIVKEKGYWRGEVEQFKKNGEKAYVDMAISLLYDSEGKPRAIVGINRDISDKVRYREALMASDESYRGLYNAVEEAIYVQNPDGSFLDVNEGAVKMYGYPRTFFLGKNPADLSPPGKNDMKMVMGKFQKALKGEPQVFEFWGKRANGEIFPKIVRLYKGKYFGKDVVIALAMDISDQKKAEENLRKLTAAVEQSPNSIIITDPEGKVEYVNQKFCEVSQYQKDEILGKTPEFLISPQTDPSIYKTICNTIKSGEIWHGELLQERKDGSPLWEDVLISPILNDEGEITQFLWLKQDITDRKKLEEEKQRLEKQLHQNQRLETIGTLAGGIAHDFNNILTPILGYAEMIRMRYKENPQLQNQVEQIIKASLRARDLIQQILTFSRQVDHEQKPVYLQTIVNEAYHLIRASIPATISVVRKIDKNCKPVLGDPAKLHQVLMNLCTNAYQAMEEKGGTLRIELQMKTPDEQMLKAYPQLRKSNYVCLTVADTGEGMDPQTMERIFEPFFTTKGVGKGTGLGLSVVHGIVKNYDGEIIVQSEKGRGSEFSVYLPVAEIEEKDTKPKENKVEGGTEKILLVDDEPAVLQLQQKVLEHFGYQVTAFNNPVEALKHFETNGNDYQLLLTDLTMPDMTGLELAKKINALNHKMPIILATGYSEELTPSLKEKFGIREILMKPIVASQLASTIRKVLDEA